MVIKLTESQQMAFKYLVGKYPAFVSPTEIGREVGNMLGKEDRHSSFGSPLCKKLVSVGLAVKNDKGHYAAVVK